MDSLKLYTKNQIVTESKNRLEKIAHLLDDSDFEDMLQQSISWMDQVVFSPRVVIFKPEDFITYKGGNFVDVSHLKIDVVNNVYYSSESDGQTNFYFPELGLLPFLTQGTGFSALGNITSYINLKGNLNLMSRQMELNGDYELWPRDEEGKQLLQLKHKDLTRVEYLPNLDRDADSWVLYDSEYRTLKDIIFDKCNLFNAEMQISAQSLGIGDKAQSLVTYWENKLEKDKKEFTDSVLVTYLA